MEIVVSIISLSCRRDAEIQISLIVSVEIIGDFLSQYWRSKTIGGPLCLDQKKLCKNGREKKKFYSAFKLTKLKTLVR